MKELYELCRFFCTTSKKIMYLMEYINEIKENFSTDPLTGDKLNEFYVDTFEARMGNTPDSPIEELFESCIGNNTNFIHLLLGHKGCGKSTELNKLEKRFKEEGTAVKKIDCESETDFEKLEVEDILILIYKALCEICEDKKIKIDQDDIKTLNYFFAKKDEQIINEKKHKIGLISKIGLGISKLISLGTEVETQIINTSENTTIIRKELINRFSEWNDCVYNIIKKIKDKDKKYPIIIFENFDKISAENAIKIFEKGYLQKIQTYIIYTFPISASYNEKFGTIMQYAKPYFFPMINIKTKEGKRKNTGYNTIKEIIVKRTKNFNLFEENVIDILIEKTGGSLKDVFICIDKALWYIQNHSKNKVSIDDIKQALQHQKSELLSRRITKKDYPSLMEIHKNKIEIEDRNELLRFFEANFVFEYKNGELWHDLHPLVYDLLKEKKIIN